MDQLGTGLFTGVDEEICCVLGLRVGRHLGQLSTALEVAHSPVRCDQLVDLVRQLYGVVSCNLGERKPSRENWRWRPRFDIDPDNESAEVVLERAVALLAQHNHLKEWCNQIPVASGLVDSRSDKRAAVDLAKIARGEGRLDLYELKCESNNPVFAAFEILGYGLAYLLCRINKEIFGYANLDTMKVNTLGLNVLAPRSYYKRFEKDFDLTWLQAGLDAGIRTLCQERLAPDFSASFRFLALPEMEMFMSGAEATAACGVSDLAPKAKALRDAMSALKPFYPTPSPT